MQLLFEEKFQELYGDIKEGEDESENDEKKDLSIEDQIKKELQELKGEETGKDLSSGETKKKDP